MELIGLLDSPYVRRVAIALLALRQPFTHRPVSVFRGYDAFRAINPVVKAPTLRLADGTLLMDSALMLQYVAALQGQDRLLPAAPDGLALALHRVGLAQAACEKTAQIVYERGLRPAEKQHQPWIDRVSSQLQAAYAALEASLARSPLSTRSCLDLGQAGISAAVAWYFSRQMLPALLDPQQHPHLVALSAAAETLPEFRAAPYGEGLVLGRS